jgi:protein-S-isoprenylcysteine O-methyltransferase Ste14
MPLLAAALVAVALGGSDMAGTIAGRRALQGVGALLAVVGHAVRVWSLGYSGVTTRSLEVNARALATGGPYAYCRNPMYWGNFLVGLGVVLFVQLWWVLGVYIVAFWLEYYAVVRVEEAYLRRRFSEEYYRYTSAVPRFRPRFTRYEKASGRMDWSVLSGAEYQAPVGTILMVALIELARYLHLVGHA